VTEGRAVGDSWTPSEYLPITRLTGGECGATSMGSRLEVDYRTHMSLKCVVDPLPPNRTVATTQANVGE
jgi:hypothetical protein